MLIATGLWGAAVIALICAQSVDIKRLIAFSSVGHIRLSVGVVLRGYYYSITSGVLIMLTHGFSSSLAFFMAFLFYKSYASRSLVILKRGTSLRGPLILS